MLIIIGVAMFVIGAGLFTWTLFQELPPDPDVDLPDEDIPEWVNRG